MQWSDVTRTPPQPVLRQFAGLLLIVFGGLAAWRGWHGVVDAWTWTWAALGLGLGVAGLIQPRAVRLVFTTWLVVVFPIGWTVSRVILAALYFLVFTPVAIVFRLNRRDALGLRRSDASSYWSPKPGPADAKQYFRQF